MGEPMRFGDVAVTYLDGQVAQVEIQRAPNNFFDVALIEALADAFAFIDADAAVRASVLCADGKHFCAGANFASSADRQQRAERREGVRNPLYQAAVKLFENRKYVVAAVQGAAVGGGFGLAMFSDFRVGCPESRFTANFVKLGFTPGFGLTTVLPRVIGAQAANELFATGRRVAGDEALKLGIIDRLVTQDQVRSEAVAFAREIAENAPLALLSIRKQMRGDLAAAVQAATDAENAEQFRLQQTDDYAEGVRAVAARRPGNFSGH